MTDNAQPLLSIAGLNVAVGGRILVRDLDMRLRGGEILAILGRNGAGKTTLLNTLAGLRPASGSVLLLGRPYAAHGARQAARLRGLLAQTRNDGFPASVLETALIGRHPHLGRWAWEDGRDLAIARAALAAVGLAGLEQREAHTLSGGERQRLAVATLLAQQPQLYLLDEPLAHLDLAHQIAILELVGRQATEHRAGFVIVLHDMNLALRYSHRALLLFGEGRWIEGASDQVLSLENLARLYGQPLRELADGDRRQFVPA